MLKIRKYVLYIFLWVDGEEVSDIFKYRPEDLIKNHVLSVYRKIKIITHRHLSVIILSSVDYSIPIIVVFVSALEI